METINHLYESLEKEKATLHDNLSYFFFLHGEETSSSNTSFEWSRAQLPDSNQAAI